MKNKRFRRYWLLACVGVALASCYPLVLGVSFILSTIAILVANDMFALVKDDNTVMLEFDEDLTPSEMGAVLQENYPKYIIPYTPICVALLAGVCGMPLWMRWLKRRALAGGACVALVVFFALELLLERKVVVTTPEAVATLEDWQMYMCYTTPSYKTKTAVEILMGEYDPAFKLHFYMISVVLILLNSLYGFGQMANTGDTRRLGALLAGSACALAFLGLCILACFTAFWRDGSLAVSPLSAALMAAFFVLLGVTAGVFAGSHLLGKGCCLAIFVPALVASAMTLIMYLGEMILLDGRLYRLGSGALFDALPGIALAPADLLVIAASGCITASLCAALRRRA